MKNQLEKIIADTTVEFKKKMCLQIIQKQNSEPTVSQMRFIKQWVRHLEAKELAEIKAKLNLP